MWQRWSPHSDGLKYFCLYERKLHSAHEEKARLRFLNDCLDECVLPRSIPRGENPLGEAFSDHDRNALQDRITTQRRSLGSKFHEVRLARNAYKCLLPTRLHKELHELAKCTVNRNMEKVRHDLT